MLSRPAVASNGTVGFRIVFSAKHRGRGLRAVMASAAHQSLQRMRVAEIQASQAQRPKSAGSTMRCAATALKLLINL